MWVIGMWVIGDHLRPSGHICLIMQVIEAWRASILVPHDHLHINHESALPAGP